MRRRMKSAARPRPTPIEITTHDGLLAHYVTDVEMAAADHRWLQALCGRTFTPAGLTVPPGPLCSLCVDVEFAQPHRPAPH
jgi:hypothetical protein